MPATTAPPLRSRVLLALTVLLALLALLAPTVPALAATGEQAKTPRAPSPHGAEVVAVTRVADRQADLSVRSAALGGRTVEVRSLPMLRKALAIDH